MRYLCLAFVLWAPASWGSPGQAGEQAPASPSQAVPVRTEFHIRYISGSNVYIDGGRNAGLTEGTRLVLKQDPTRAADDPLNASLQPGIVARLSVVSVASSSAVCEIEAKARELRVGETVWMADDEVAKLVQKETLGNTRKYPMVVSFTEGDPLDEEVRDAQPRPPLPEVNQFRGRIGFDLDNIQELGQGGSRSSEYGMILRADFTRIWGTHWNLNGYWRGSIQRSSALAQSTLQNTLNRTYLMSFSYINPESRWSAGIGRLFVPYATSLETIDGAYLGMGVTSDALITTFAGSTPDPTAWDYNPKNRIGGVFFNMHGGSYDGFHHSTSVGGGANMIQWQLNRPFVFTENEFSYKRFFSLFHSMQIDKPTPNPNTAPIGLGLGQSIFTMRLQVHPRVTVDVSDTYFRDVPTYDSNLVGTGLLDKYLYQGINGGARIQLPYHVTGYFTLGQSNNSTDKKNSLNKVYGATLSKIWRTGLQVDARYSEFDSAFASGTYKSVMVTRDLGERFRINVQGGRYAYASSLAVNNNSDFVNGMFDTNLGARLFFESAFTTQRGGSLSYNQWINTVGFRFDNRRPKRKQTQ